MINLQNLNAVVLPYSERELSSKIKSFVDLTTLEGSDNDAVVSALCAKAIEQKTAAVCVYPPFAALVRRELKGTNIKTACVAGAFPSGQSPIEVKLAEVAYAVNKGAQEIDMVISRGALLEGDYRRVGEEIRLIKEACGSAHLKVILETGELQSEKNIKLASELAIANGADFIKTSTGKIAIAATLEASLVMVNVIQEHFRKTGVRIGFKPAGGISQKEDALQYMRLVYGILGEDWMCPELFRIGASRLVDRV